MKIQHPYSLVFVDHTKLTAIIKIFTVFHVARKDITKPKQRFISFNFIFFLLKAAAAYPLPLQPATLSLPSPTQYLILRIFGPSPNQWDVTFRNNNTY